MGSPNQAFLLPSRLSPPHLCNLFLSFKAGPSKVSWERLLAPPFPPLSPLLQAQGLLPSEHCRARPSVGWSKLVLLAGSKVALRRGFQNIDALSV